MDKETTEINALMNQIKLKNQKRFKPMKFKVCFTETCENHIIIEADSEDQAFDKFNDTEWSFDDVITDAVVERYLMNIEECDENEENT